MSRFIKICFFILIFSGVCGASLRAEEKTTAKIDTTFILIKPVLAEERPKTHILSIKYQNSLLNGDINGATIRDIFEELKKQAGLDYEIEKAIQAQSVSITLKDKELVQAIDDILNTIGNPSYMLRYEKGKDGKELISGINITKRGKIDTSLVENGRTKMEFKGLFIPDDTTVLGIYLAQGKQAMPKIDEKIKDKDYMERYTALLAAYMIEPQNIEYYKKGLMDEHFIVRDMSKFFLMKNNEKEAKKIIDESNILRKKNLGLNENFFFEIISKIKENQKTRKPAFPVEPFYNEAEEEIALYGEEAIAYAKKIIFNNMDNDGDEDLYVVTRSGKNIFYKNNGGNNFTDITDSTGTGNTGAGYAAVFFDYDNDGYLDLFVANSGSECVLYKNNGENAWLKTNGPWSGKDISARSVTVSDLDFNGYLDLFIGCNGVNKLYSNNGSSGWIETSGPWQNISDNTRDVKSCDIDNDGDMDILAINYFELNRLYENQGNGTFMDKTVNSGLTDLTYNQSGEFTDSDNDGDMDIILTNGNGASSFYNNNGHGVFSKLNGTGLEITENNNKNVVSGSFRNDTLQEIMLVREASQNKFFINKGANKFTEITHQANLDTTLYSQKASISDIDNDGDLDMYLVNQYSYGVLYQNQQDDNRYLKIKLKGLNINRDSYGAKIEIFDSGYPGVIEHLKGSREVSSRSTHIGLGELGKADIRIKFPGGWTEITRKGVLSGQSVEIAEPFITVFNSLPGNSRIKLRWANPDERDYDLVKIVRNENNYPVDYSDGLTVYEGRDTAFTDESLINGKEYFYGVFLTSYTGKISPAFKLSRTKNVTDGIFPNIVINNVSDGRYYSTSVYPEITINDSNLYETVITLNGEIYASGKEISGDGSYDLYVYAKDKAENISERRIGFTIDKTKPEVTITGVENGKYYNNERTAVIVISGANLDTSSITLNGNNYVSGSPITEDGYFTLNVYAKDKAGNISETTFNFTIDKTLPEIKVTGAENNKYYSTNITPEIIITDSNLYSTTITLNGKAYAGGTEIYEDGEYILNITASDLVYNSSSVNIQFTIDKTYPETVISGVVNGNYYNNDVTPLVSIKDLYLDSFWIYLNGLSWLSGTNETEEGKYYLTAGAIDKAGNRTNTAVDFTIDKTLPEITVSGFMDSAYYNIDISPVININDLYPDSSIITLNGQAFASGTPVTVESTYVLYVWARDLATNESNRELTFIIDKTAPKQITSLTIGTGNGKLSLNWVNPEDSDLKGVKMIRREDRFPQDKNDGTEIYDGFGVQYLDTGLVNDQKYYYSLFTYDIAGNYSTGVNIAGSPDKTPPEILISGVTEGEYYNSTKTAEISITDANLKSTGIRLNNASYISGTPIAEEGVYKLSACGKDIAENESNKEVNFIIDKTVPGM